MYLEFSYHWQIAQLTGFFTFVYTHFILLRQQENLKCVYLIKKQEKGQKRSWGKKNKNPEEKNPTVNWIYWFKCNKGVRRGVSSPPHQFLTWEDISPNYRNCTRKQSSHGERQAARLLGVWIPCWGSLCLLLALTYVFCKEKGTEDKTGRRTNRQSDREM